MFQDGPDMKNKLSASEFPNISRLITENGLFKKTKNNKFRLLNQAKLNKIAKILGIFLVFVLTFSLAFGIVVFSIRIYSLYGYIRQINTEKQSLQDKVNFWQSVAGKYDGYKDAYFQMAVYDYQLGNYQKSKQENQQALLLDPNFENAKRLETLLDKK